MKAECNACGKKPDRDDWKHFEYTEEGFYCRKCKQNKNNSSPDGICSICNREHTEIQEHHLVPKSQGGSDDEENLAEVCPSCHNKIHATFSNYELEYKYNSVKKLKNAPQMETYIKCIRKTDKRRVKFKESQRAKYM